MGLTIRDVAKAAGVSTATVSNVLNKTGKVGRRTHLLVLSTVKRLGYFPNVHARHLASRDSRTLGIIVSDIENPFFPEVIKSFEIRARQLARRRIAVTFLDLAPVRSYMSNLKIDYFSGVEQIIKYLHGNGHRRIAFVAGRPRLKSNIARLQAYEKCMQDLGLEAGPVLPGDLRFEGGLAAGSAIAKLSSKPTAVVAVNDLTAVGVIKGLLKAGFRVPEDISVTGFDNTRLAEYSNPSITTVDVHREMVGQMAADALHELSCSANPQGKEYQIPAELILGDSSGPAPSE